ncbi:MAG TPA: hypothetical protein VGR73_11425 [Bryobacteraceae bacterium]|nr:hypothetical protein [Bryobacteraceae bacterium]
MGYTYGSTNNNGNVQTQAITRGASSWTQSYGYDNVNRLNCANEAIGAAVSCSANSGAWSQTYGFDNQGNRWVATSSSALPVLTRGSSTEYGYRELEKLVEKYKAAGGK